MPSRRILQACATLLLLAVAFAPLGCKAKVPASQAVPEASVPATGSVEVTAAAGGATSTVNGRAASALTSDEAAQLDAELAAIQRELDKMSVPDDGDFSGIESGLK